MFGYACLDAGFNISQVSRSYGLSKTNEALHLKTSKFWPRENGNNNSDCYKTDPKMPDVSVFNFSGNFPSASASLFTIECPCGFYVNRNIC